MRIELSFSFSVVGLILFCWMKLNKYCVFYLILCFLTCLTCLTCSACWWMYVSSLIVSVYRFCFSYTLLCLYHQFKLFHEVIIWYSHILILEDLIILLNYIWMAAQDVEQRLFTTNSTGVGKPVRFKHISKRRKRK